LKRSVIGLCGAVLLSLALVAAGAIKIDRIYFDSREATAEATPA
jgi:hypothetical protein